MTVGRASVSEPRSQKTSRSDPLLSVRGLSKRFPVAFDVFGRPRSWLWAVDFVDLDVFRGETLALVGESGCGKTTLARLILRLLSASSGSVRFEETDVLAATDQEMRRFRKRAQIIVQDPVGSLDERRRVGAIVVDGLYDQHLPEEERKRRTHKLLDLVGLSSDIASRYPHELSGGERQRVVVARALAVDPTFLVADEPLSALDVSVQSRILNVFRDLKRDLGLTYLFISHDLSVVRQVADRVAVMYLGRIVETAPASELFENPLHPYTQALLSSVPYVGRRSLERLVLRGEPQSPIDPPQSCHFASRCFRAIDRCRSEIPYLDAIAQDPTHRVACFNFAPVGARDDSDEVGTSAAATRDDPVLISASAASPEKEPLAPAERDNSLGRAGRVRGSSFRSPVVASVVARRLGYALLLLILSSVLVFGGLSAAPGDVPVSPVERERLGLDRPVAVQYLLFLRNLFTGDPGSSLVNGAEISTIIRNSGANTLRLGLAAAILVYVLAIPLGVIAAVRRNSPADYGVRAFTAAAMGVPQFFLAILLIQLFGVKLKWLPVAGTGGLDHLALPAIVLALESVAINLRLVRSSLLEEVSKDYIRALRARGIAEARITWIHALRNALVPIIAYAGVTIPLLLGTTVIVEVMFRFPGLGYQLVQSVLNRDYFLASTLALMFTALVIACNLLANVAHRLVDPRVRLSGSAL